MAGLGSGVDAVAAKGNHDEKTLQNRVVLRMVNEAVFCLQDGTLHNALDGDIGAVFGYALEIDTA